MDSVSLADIGIQLRAMLLDIFRSEAPAAIYAGPHTYRVAADSTGAPATTSPAGRINLEPIEKGLPTIPRVDQWPGVAGCTSFPGAGSLVIVGFRDSRPDRPFIHSFQAARLQGGVPIHSVIDASTSIKVGPSVAAIELAGGGPAIGRVNDGIITQQFSVTAPSGTTGGPCVITVGAGTALTGHITSGSPKVTSG